MTPGVALSVVVPAHDEAANLARLVEEVRDALEPTGLVWELIVVDDGSTDDTPATLARLAAGEPRVRSLRLAARSGQTAALAAGFRAARGPLVATLDADLQCPPRELPALLQLLDGAAMASGIRSGRHDPPTRRLASALANGVRRAFLAPRIRDLACPIRVMRADALARVTARFPLFYGAHRWLAALFHIAGERVVQRPVTHQAREAGLSKYTTRGRVVPIARELVHVLGLTAGGRRAAKVALVALAALPFFWALGRWPLLEPDEARNAEVAREMLALGNWSVPHFNGLPYLDKPVLLFWLIGAGFSALGTGEFAARMPAALGAWATVLLTFATARLLLPRRDAILAAAMLASAPLALAFGRLAIFDMPLTALVTGAVYCLVRARASARPGRWIVAAGVALGLATLTKGPVGFAVPLVAWVVARGALPAPRATRRLAVAAAVVAGAVVVAPWLVSVANAEPGFLRYALLDETFLRFSSTARFHRGGPFYYYAGVLAWGLGAWAAVLAAVTPALWREWRTGGPRAAAIAFAARAALAIVVFFSACASKRPAYVLPAIVPLAILTATGAALDPRRTAAAIRALAAVAGVGALVALGGLVAGRLPVHGAAHGVTPAVVGIGATFVLGWAMVAFRAGRRPAVAIAAAVLLAPGLGAVLLGPLAGFAEGRSSRALAARIAPGARVVCFKTFRTGLPFYLGRPVELASNRGSEMTSNWVVARPRASRRQIVPEEAFLAELARGDALYTVASTMSFARLSRLSQRRLVPVYADRHSVLVRAEG